MSFVGFYVVIKASDIPVVFTNEIILASQHVGMTSLIIYIISHHYEVHQSDREMRSPFFQCIAIMSLWEELVSS